MQSLLVAGGATSVLLDTISSATGGGVGGDSTFSTDATSRLGEVVEEEHAGPGVTGGDVLLVDLRRWWSLG